MNRKIGFLAAGLMALSLMSCSSLEKTIAEEAAQSATILNEYQEVRTQLQMIGQVTVSVDEKDYIVPLTWTADNPDMWEISGMDEELLIVYATPKNLPKVGEEPVEFKLTATATYEGHKASKVFEGKLMPTEQVEVKKISEVVAMEVDSTKVVSIRGVIRPTYGGSTSAIVTDETGSILVYSKEGIDVFTAGQTVIVKGTRGVNQKYVYGTDGNKIDGVTVDNPELVYRSMIVVDPVKKEIDMTSAVETTVEAINSWNTDPQSTDFVNQSGKLFKITCDIVRYAPIDPDTGKEKYHVWEACPHGATKPYLQFYCNSSVQENLDAIDAYLAGFEGKQVTLGLMVYDFNSKYSSSSVKNTFRFVPVSVVAIA